MGILSSMLNLVEWQGTRSIKYVTPVKPGEAEGLLSAVYPQVQQGFGAVVPPFSLHSPMPEVAAAIWSITRETLLVGQVPRSHKEAISAAVSKTNACPYCVEAHTISLYAASEPEAAAAISEGHQDRIQDPSLRGLVDWALACRSPDSKALKSPPFGSGEAPEIIGTAVAFQHINRMANIFLDDSPMPVSLPEGILNRVLKRIGGAAMRDVIRQDLPPGESLSLLPEASLPEDLAWASTNPTVAEAFARATAAIETAADGVISEPVRQLVDEYLQAWRGEDVGMSRSWADKAIAGIYVTDKPVARLALLTALASYQVDEIIVAEARARRLASEADLIAAVAWASFTAARRIGSWLATPNALAANSIPDPPVAGTGHDPGQ
jgi:AhpD family alkylhydroperoxidase